MSFFKVTVGKYAFPFLWEKYFSLAIISALLDSLMLGYTAVMAKGKKTLLRKLKNTLPITFQ